MNSDVTTIKDRLNIVDLVGEYVRLTKTGTNHKACCPFHEEKTPSFIVTEDRGTYHCFGCGKGGDAIAFVMEIEGMEFREALQLLADRTGVALQKYTPEQKKARDEKARLYDAMSLSVQFYQKQLAAATGGKAARAYLHNRGISDTTIDTFHIGYAPQGWHHSEEFLTGRGFTAEELTRVGLLIQKDGQSRGSGYYDRFRDRIMFPIHDMLGRTIGYSARILPAPKGQDAQDPGAKYINTPESPLYHKSDILYGIDIAKQSIKKENHAILVEGQMDVIASHEAGITNIVGVSGTALTDSHITILKRYCSHFTLFFDGDAAGQKAAHKSAAMCLKHDVAFSLVALDDGKDAADLVRENPEALAKAVASARGAMEFFIAKSLQEHDIKDPHDKRKALEDILALVVHIAHPVERAEWLKKCAEAYDVTLQIIEEVLATLEASHTPSRQGKITGNGEAPPKKITPQAERAKTGKEDHTIGSIMKLALAFPEAWKTLEEAQASFPFIAQHETLGALIREGPEHSYDAMSFLEKHARDSAQKYHIVSAYHEEYGRTHSEKESAMREIIILARRAQNTHHKERLEEYAKKLKKAEHDGDTQKKKHYIQEIAELSQHV